MSEIPMLVPKHCSEVAVINAGEKFSPEKTLTELLGVHIFYLTKFIILREKTGRLTVGERVSVLKVKAEGESLLKTIIGGEVLAPPDKCETLVDPTLDEFALNQVVLKAVSAKSNTATGAVIMSGRNENITFVYLGDEDLLLPLKIMVVDVSPPRPNTLETLSRKARNSGLVSKHVHVSGFNVDVSNMENELLKGGRQILKPCSTGETTTRNQSFMDFKTFTNRAKKNKKLSVDLIGCTLSLAVLFELKKITGFTPETPLRDICPLHTARKVASSTDVHGIIVRCCKITGKKKVIHIHGKPSIVLPWTPTLGEFVTGIDELVRLITGLKIE